jgi:hypothetical protein
LWFYIIEALWSYFPTSDFQIHLECYVRYNLFAALFPFHIDVLFNFSSLFLSLISLSNS